MRQVHRITSKWHCTLQGQMYPTYMLLISPISIFSRFALRTAVFESQEKYNEWPPKWLWTIQSQMYPIISIYALLVFTSHKFPSVLLYKQPFLRYRPFSPNDPKMTQNPTSSNVSHIYVTSVPDSNLQPLCSSDSCFWVTGHFDKVQLMTPQNDIESYKIKYSPYLWC